MEFIINVLILILLMIQESMKYMFVHAALRRHLVSGVNSGAPEAFEDLASLMF